MKVLLVNDTSTSANWGCRATSAAIKTLIEHTGAHVSSTIYLSELEIRRPVPGPNDMSDLIPESANDLDVATRLVEQGVAARQWVERILDSDIVLINGEGSIYDNQRKGRALLFVAHLSRHFQRPCALVNHTADIKHPALRGIAERVYPELDDVVCREGISARSVSSMISVPAEECFAPDAAFIHRPLNHELFAAVGARTGYFSTFDENADAFDPTRPYACVAGSSIYFRADRPDYDPVPGFRSLCEAMLNEVGQVVLLACDAPDERLARAISSDIDLPIIALRTPIQQAIDILGNAAVMISGRWHPSIFAVTGGTPVVLISANTHKTDALPELIGLDQPTFDALDINRSWAAVAHQAKLYLDQGNDLARRLRGRAAELASLSPRHVEILNRT